MFWQMRFNILSMKFFAFITLIMNKLFDDMTKAQNNFIYIYVFT